LSPCAALLHRIAQVFQRIATLEVKQVETDKKIDKVLNAIESKDAHPKQGIFSLTASFRRVPLSYPTFSGPPRNQSSIIDNYSRQRSSTHLAKRRENVTVTILTKTISKHLMLDIKKFNEQYPAIEIKEFNNAHDRFIIVDQNTVYQFWSFPEGPREKNGLRFPNGAWAVEMLGN